MSVRKSPRASFQQGLVKNFGVITIKIFLALVREVPAECGRNVLRTEVRLMFVKSVYLIEE